MYWIVENKNQLERLAYNKPCFINIVPLNHNYHPKLTGISLIYYKTEGHKGYIFPINHNDGISLDIDLIKTFLLKHPSIYVLDKKKILHYLGDRFKENKVVDINLLHLENTIYSLELPNYKSIVTNYIEGSFKIHQKLNSFIPITKHYEEQELIYDYVKDYIGNQHISMYYNVDYIYSMYCIEKEGINIDRAIFDSHFALRHPQFSIKEDKIYTQYNLYNFTSRPSNAFNSVNFAALNKSDNTREFLIPRNGFLFEFDMKSYHILLSAKLIGYIFEGDDIHTEMGKMYFNKEILTPEDYKKSKQLSFKMMNGGVFPQYKHVPFWEKLAKYIEKLWKEVNNQGFIELVGGRKIKLEEIINPTPQKIYNYIIQSAETYFNILNLKDLLDYLDNKKSKCILYTYDSFLINYNIEDDKNIIKEIKNILETRGFKSSVSYGIDYNNLKQIK